MGRSLLFPLGKLIPCHDVSEVLTWKYYPLDSLTAREVDKEDVHVSWVNPELRFGLSLGMSVSPLRMIEYQFFGHDNLPFLEEFVPNLKIHFWLGVVCIIPVESNTVKYGETSLNHNQIKSNQTGKSLIWVVEHFTGSLASPPSLIPSISEMTPLEYLLDIF